LDSTGSGQGPVAGCCECGDEPSGSCATELVELVIKCVMYNSKILLSPYYIYPVLSFLRHWGEETTTKVALRTTQCM
jgi:hypothetical protein